MFEYNMLNIKIHAMDIDAMHELISKAVKAKQKIIISSQNLHSVYLANRKTPIQQLQSLPHTYKRIDGMPLIWFGKLLGYPLNKEYRVTWVDWMDPLMHEAQEKHWEVFYLGSKQEIVDNAINILRKKYPKLLINYKNGYFNKQPESQENKQTINSIKEASPDILIVGMGMPLQEKWILDNLEKLNTPVILTCGAAMEYVAGAVTTPPRWMGKYGLEWLYRLSENPGRFAHRYLVEPWYLAPLAIKDMGKRAFNKKSE